MDGEEPIAAPPTPPPFSPGPSSPAPLMSPPAPPFPPVPSAPGSGPVPSAPGAPGVAPRARRWPWVVALVVVALVVGAGAVVAIHRSGDPGPSHPEAWDPKVADLANFVEETRGRDFTHPVAVHFLSAAAYAKRITDHDAPTKGDRADADRTVAADRALGLVQGDVDLFETSDDMGSEGTAAFYDPATDAIYVNGTDLDVATKVTVVHEMTHALQAQIVAAAARGEDGGPADDTTDAGSAYDALVEGDATSVEDAYVATLSDAQADEYDASSDTSADASKAALDGDRVPAAYQAAFALPYALGAPWVDVAIGRDGPEAIAEALVHPPATTASLVDLARNPRTGPTKVAAPPPASGAKVLDTDRYGPASWIVPLAEYTDGPTAFAAVQGWQGDSVVTSRKGSGPVCVDAVVALADAPAASRFESAGRAWFARLPAAAGATVRRDGDRVDLHSCDPGPSAPVAPTGRAMDELGHVITRNQLISELQGGGAGSVDDTACVADHLLATYGADRLANDADLAGSDQMSDSVRQSAAACGLGG